MTGQAGWAEVQQVEGGGQRPTPWYCLGRSHILHGSKVPPMETPRDALVPATKQQEELCYAHRVDYYTTGNMNEPQLYMTWVGHRDMLLNDEDAMKMKTAHIRLSGHVYNMYARISFARQRD